MRQITLIASFLILTFLLYLFSQSATQILPCFVFLLLLADYWGGSETLPVYLFLTALATLGLGTRDLPEGHGLWLFLELGGLGLYTWILLLLRGKQKSKNLVLHQETAALRKKIEEAGKDIQFYQRHQKNLHLEEVLRQRLAEAVRELSGTLDPTEIRNRLETLLRNAFPHLKSAVVPLPHTTPMEEWVQQKKTSLRVEDLQRDSRFASQRAGSIGIAPLKILGEIAGMLRVESPQPGGVRQEDLRILDLLATLASLSLENIHLFEQVQQLAIRDGLTQLYTHRYFQERLNEEILRSGRYGNTLALALFDVDHFKNYNDTRGHPAGDALLKLIAGLLVRFSREVDLVARYGGEEFAMIFPGLNPEQTLDITEKIRENFHRESSLMGPAITLSAGIAGFPKDALTASQMVRTADERLYAAKQRGRNQVVAEP